MCIVLQSAPPVQAPEMKSHPRERQFGDGITVAKSESLMKQDGESPASRDSPQAPKLTFGLTKKSSGGRSGTPAGATTKSKLESIFSTEDEEMELKPKKKLVPIDYSDEEQEHGTNNGDHGRKRDGGGKREREGGESDVAMKLALLKPADSGKKLSSEERKKLVQTLVNNIPTSKEEVFKYELKWDQIDQVSKENNNIRYESILCSPVIRP